MSKLVLLPCPFCAGLADFGVVEDPPSLDHGGHYIACQNRQCHATTALVMPQDAPHGDPAHVLAERWNRRWYGNPLAASCE